MALRALPPRTRPELNWSTALIFLRFQGVFQTRLIPRAKPKPQVCSAVPMNPGNPPPYPGPGPSAPYPPYPQQPMGPQVYPPGPAGGPYPPPPQGYPYQGYPQYGWQGGPQEPPKTTVYVVEDQRRDDLGPSTCLTACWTALCCCCLWDMLT
ncbi:cysteine-rich and transmembrane domain-containing protein 1 isoform X2 [Sus scrofa]|uniref:cysteine-rich and transmembrane domain-containing protein 1 isoform X2 n=1 Tax=Sus scrofa TaxID=9823 RepID=UPI00022CE1CF|nr:cysteine-rich and transmembrane domain-containing protein 1 isoform X2 [Sus scrofa]